MKLTMLSRDELPREKLRSKGPSALSNADLIAIILRTGTEQKNVLDVARELLAANGNSLVALSASGPEQLCEHSGIGKDKAASLTAVFELVRRIMEEEPARKPPVIADANTAFLCMEPRLKDLDHEECWLMYLSRNLKLIGTERLSTGTPTSTGADITTIVTKALSKKACKLIMFHNHPDAGPTPGEQDIETTLMLKRALHSVRLTLLDHIIIGEGGYYSFADEKVINV